MNYREMKGLVARIDGYVMAHGIGPIRAGGHKRFNHEVHFQHGDGSTFHLKNAYALMIGEWIVIVSEHNGEWVHHWEDLKFLWVSGVGDVPRVKMSVR